MIAEDLGFAVNRTADAAAFVELLNRYQPSHIAVDLMMPDVDGVEILRLLAERQCTAQIIITSSMGKRVLDAALRAGRARGLRVKGVLPKPFMPAHLRELLVASSSRPAHSLVGETLPLQVDKQTLLTALAQRQMRMVYQPKMTTQFKIAGFEALMRWYHPDYGEIPPMQFITAAERCGVIQDFTRYAVSESVQWLAAQQCPESVGMAINLSMYDVESTDLVEAIAVICSAAGVASRRITLELTETAAMTNPADALDVLARLRIKGFCLSIDDFGTGFSSMSQLARMPFSEVKIDRSFILTALESSESLTIVRAIIELAHNLDLQVVAEGVEDEATCQLLCELQCELLQGYYFSRPLEADAATALLQNGSSRSLVRRAPPQRGLFDDDHDSRV